MPFRYYGVGTKYYGRKNEEIHQGKCEFCNQNATLKTYNTLKTFSLLFIPLISLGEKKIIDKCSICGRHKAVSIKKWEKLKTESIKLVFDDWIQQPDSIETINGLLDTIQYFRDADKLNYISDEIYNRYSNNAGVINRLGNVFKSLNQFSKAEKAYRKSLQIEDNKPVRENLAEVLMKNSKPDEAKQLIWHIVTEKDMGKIYYIYLLIESYQFIGEHIKALEIIEDCVNNLPEIENDKKLSYYRKISKRNYHKNNCIKGKLITCDSEMQKMKNSSFLIPKLIGPSIIILAFLFYLFTVFRIGASREVYLVNGVDKTYTIEINGEENVLEPLSNNLVKLPEGTLNVEILDLDTPEDNFEVEIKTPFWSKPFNKPIFIINPDKTAVLQKQEVVYLANKSIFENNDFRASYLTGKSFYEFEKTDYLFEELPETIMVEDGSAIKKIQLIHLNYYFKQDKEVYYMYLNSIGLEDAVLFMEKQLCVDPNNYDILVKYRQYASNDRIIKLCRSNLSKRPVLVNLHKVYQEQMEIYKPTYDLVGEYTEYLENDKDNNDLCYLLSRVTDDIELERQLLEKSIEGDNPCEFGYYGLAYMNLGEGNFEDAAFYSKKALDLDNGSADFTWVYKKALLANKEYDLLLSHYNDYLKQYPKNKQLVQEKIYIHMAKGDIDGANKTINSYMATIEESSEEEKEAWERNLKGIISYCVYDYPTFIESIKNSGNAAFNFVVAFHYGQYDVAEIIAKNYQMDSEFYLLLYLSESDNDIANQYLDSAIADYQRGDKTERLLAQYFLGEKEWGIEEVKAIRKVPDLKRTIVLALAKTKPELKEELFDLAEKLNFELIFPHNTIEEIIETENF